MSVVLLLLCVAATMLKPKKQLAGQSEFTVQVWMYVQEQYPPSHVPSSASKCLLFSPHYLTHIHMEEGLTY